VADNFYEYLLDTANVIYKFVFINGELVGGLHVEIAEKIGTFSIVILNKNHKKELVLRY